MNKYVNEQQCIIIINNKYVKLDMNKINKVRLDGKDHVGNKNVLVKPDLKRQEYC